MIKVHQKEADAGQYFEEKIKQSTRFPKLILFWTFLTLRAQKLTDTFLAATMVAQMAKECNSGS